MPRLIAALRLEDRVQIVDRMLTVEELVRQYSTARVALVPSFFEGFGFPASEAMACGLPVVANAAGALPEVVGTDGQRRPARAPTRRRGAMADAIADILSAARSAAERMGARRAPSHPEKRLPVERRRRAGLVDVFEETLRAAHRRSRAA